MIVININKKETTWQQLLSKLVLFVVSVAGLLTLCLNVSADETAVTPEQESVLQNPTIFSPQSIKRGRQLYRNYCAVCHGIDGTGDTQMREFLKTPPANLVDMQWTYGEYDGDLFEVIKHGKVERDMEAFGDRLSDEHIWHVINYIRYIGGKKP